ncbi:MAG: acylphosphatase [Methylococcaceae bacterium]|jgi:acylphosphatase
MRRVRMRLAGRVQGVYFRASTRKIALGLNLSGWVRNLADGRVEVLAEGDESAVAELVAWCRSGPPQARVDVLALTEETPEGEPVGFSVVADA